MFFFFFLHRHINVRHTKGNNKSAAKNSVIPAAQRGSTHSGSVINHHGNSINGCIISWSAGRHRHSKLHEDREDWEDRGWPELSLQTVVCNALWESRSPRSLRQGINQAHGWDKRRPSAAPFLPPSLPGIDWRLLSIDLRPFSVISCPQSHLGDRYRVNFSPQSSVIIICAACRHLHKSTPTKILSAAMWFVSPFPALHLLLPSCVTTGPGIYGAKVLLSVFCFGRHISIECTKPCTTGRPAQISCEIKEASGAVMHSYVTVSQLLMCL